MHIEWQVIGQQADVVRQQRRQAFLAHPGNAGILTFPEIAVVHQYGVGPFAHGKIQQFLAGSHPSDDFPDLATSFHLQAVWAIIAQFSGLQQTIQVLHQ